jgi:REP element-mobilizing transposase RayT
VKKILITRKDITLSIKKETNLMARPLRVEYPGAFYHVINRGNAGENLFKSKRDREKFLEYIEIASERFSIMVHTYCLMNNHYLC